VKSAIALVTLAAICAGLTACGGAPPLPLPPTAKPQTASTPTPGFPGKPGQTGPPQLVPPAPAIPAPEPAKYADKGRKDPFTEVQLSSALGGLAVATTKPGTAAQRVVLRLAAN
jgi:predicted small lipoprotein YifL